MKAIIAVLLVLISTGFGARGADDPSERIQTLDALYAAELGEAKKPVTDVDDGYRANLKAYSTEVQNAGNLDALLAVNKALGDLEKGLPLALSADAGVAAIQKSYAAKRKAAAGETFKAVEKVNRAYVAKYKALIAELTKADKVEDALNVQEKIDSILEDARREAASSGGGGSGGDLDPEFWRKKAIAEFPDLANSNSPLAQKVKARTRELRGSNPAYFNDAKWPYLITRECSEALRSAKELAERPSGKISPFQGIFSGDRGKINYLFSVDEKGSVAGLQFPLGSTTPSLISGRCAGGRLKVHWVQEGTGSKHEMEYEFQEDGSVRMEGEHEYGGAMRHHTTRLEKVTDSAEYRQVLDAAAKVISEGPKLAVLKSLEKTPPKADKKTANDRKSRN